MDESITIVLDNQDILSAVCGANDGNLRALEDFLGGQIATRGNELRAEGLDEAGLSRFKTMMERLIDSARNGETPSPDYVRALAGSQESAENSGDPFKDAMVQIPHGFGRVFPRSLNQGAYIRGMRSHDITFCVGPAGTGKTYLAIAEALRLVLSKKMRKLVLTRPVVEAGESLGFLPGDLTQKINPYLRPLYDAMEALVPYDVIRRMEESRAIEIAPLAYMRGRSLNDCMVILDEAQNTTKEQMKMFLTRIGEGARAVITGDTTQVDLPKRVDSGLLHAVSILSSVEGIHFAYLSTADVVRNPLIKKIIQAYDNEKKS
ncbi:PhoH family protein [Breznakiella homolactica]|uniref:PhoH-like protein n=1 Tax=Breznakiella homolactica TaxID=2798577 RepID=A0A7T7XLA0_9SPIR|nr:PhoH family protein [Breznakiella homolactica]QQO08293.1 PhoH family protein [Breznakiella homolactica]